MHPQSSFHRQILAVSLLPSLCFTAPAFADGSARKESGPAASAAAKAAYPLTTCVVSGDVLADDGPMGPPVDYIYKQKGKPDRLVRFCCDSCIDDFNQDPQKYLKMIDDAAAAKAKGEKPAASDGHAGHAH